MAPNLSGIESADTARIAHLVELAVEFALHHMKPEGALVAKVFHGSGYSELVKLFKETFRVVKPLKPKASRDKSSETFLVGHGARSPLNEPRSTRRSRHRCPCAYGCRSENTSFHALKRLEWAATSGKYSSPETQLNNQWFSKIAVWLVIALVLFTVFKQFDTRGARRRQR